MTVLEKVKKMQQAGKSEEEIIRALRDDGVSYREISDALAQSKIKAAVEQDEQPEEVQQQYQEYPQYPQQDYQQGYQDYQQGYQQQYNYQQPSAPTETISEIAEQIIDEKMAKIDTQLEKIRSVEKTNHTKIGMMEERLNRLEKIIDTLQLSVLQKVGDYITNVDDIKKELVETQKSFSKVIPELKKKGSSSKGKRSKKK